MLSPAKPYLYPLLVAFIMAASLPLRSTCETIDNPKATACATGCATADPVPCADSPDDVSDCGLDCTDCGLTCCVGTAVILTAALTQAAVTPIQAPPLAKGLVRPQMDPDPLGHPPRA